LPAPSTGKNIAAVELKPYLFEDGIYTLQVNGRDASGNISGDNDYMISFEVINGKAVSYIYCFPNPFNTSTRFVYTLTGESAPAQYSIQIVSMTGIVVREITKDELGPLVVGSHPTEFEWDGTDSAGNLLPAGIYLFRMTVRDEDSNPYEHYYISGDTTFGDEGWGKVVILR
jgi:flagellar hook assembly protein FlgD